MKILALHSFEDEVFRRGWSSQSFMELTTNQRFACIHLL